MDNLKTLFDKKQYELIVKVTENANDDTALFYRISAFMSLGKIDEAIKCIDLNQKILEARLPWLMKLHIELLCLAKRFDEAYDKIKYYENLPYFSQEAEEVLKELPKIARKLEREANAFGNASEEDLRENLKSKIDEVVIASLDSLRDKDLSLYYEEISNILEHFPKQLTRSFALLLLVQKKVDKEFKFLHVNDVIRVNPSKLNPPFVGEAFNNLCKRMSAHSKNPSLIENAITLLSSYLIYIYPEEIDYQDNNLLEALFELSSEFLHIDDNDYTHFEGIDVNKVKIYALAIREANKNSL